MTMALGVIVTISAALEGIVRTPVPWTSIVLEVGMVRVCVTESTAEVTIGRCNVCEPTA